MNPALRLYRLQQIELQAQESVRRLEEIAAELADNAGVLAAEQKCREAGEALKPLRARQRDLELELAGNEEKVRATGQQLYSGAVKSPREMQDMQMEMESLTRRNGDLDTWILETMLVLEEAEAQLAGHERALAVALEQRGDTQRELLEERETLQAGLPQLKEKRREALTHISAELQNQYRALRPRKGGQPVARMPGNSCERCGVSQTLTAEREVRLGRRLVTCANCGRILVAAEDC